MKRVLDCHHTRAGNPAILSSDSCLLTSTFLLLLILAAPALCAGKWQVAYFYDKEGSSLVINDLQFPSPARGIAARDLADHRCGARVARATQIAEAADEGVFCGRSARLRHRRA